MRPDLRAAIVLALVIVAPAANAETADVTAPPAAADPAAPAPEEKTPEEQKAEEKKAVEAEKKDLPNAGRPVKLNLPEEGEGASLLWKASWRKFSTAEWVITGVSLAVTLGTLFAPESKTRWTSRGILFDESARDALRPDSEAARLGWRDTSDVFLSIATTYPFLVDSVVIAGWHRKSAIVAEQLAMMNMEAFAITAAIQGLVSSFTSRERPYGRDCSDPSFGQTRDCSEINRYRSFFSGHTSIAFTAAALTCSHHANIPLYGNRTADSLACASMMALATAVGTLRVVSDQHFVSDVTLGALVGSLVGFGVPYLFHYRSSDRAPRHGLARSMIGITVAPTPQGLTVGGIFG